MQVTVGHLNLSDVTVKDDTHADQISIANWMYWAARIPNNSGSRLMRLLSYIRSSSRKAFFAVHSPLSPRPVEYCLRRHWNYADQLELTHKGRSGWLECTLVFWFEKQYKGVAERLAILRAWEDGKQSGNIDSSAWPLASKKWMDANPREWNRKTVEKKTSRVRERMMNI